MEPLRGGRLASLDPEDEKKLRSLRPQESIPAWAFRFLQSRPEVTMVLSGMSSISQMEENIRTFEEDKPLNGEEMEALLSVAEGMVKKIVLPCTACHYCVSHCPQHLDIPELLALYNEHCFTEGGFIAPMALAAFPKEKLPSAASAAEAVRRSVPSRSGFRKLWRILRESLDCKMLKEGEMVALTACSDLLPRTAEAQIQELCGCLEALGLYRQRVRIFLGRNR